MGDADREPEAVEGGLRRSFRPAADPALPGRRRRELELVERVSLQLLDPAALLRLREMGACDLSIPEVAFDLDHPGHYFRRIKTVSLSIPAVAGPHVSVGATLTLLGHETRIDPSAAAPYPRQPGSDSRFWVLSDRSRRSAGLGGWERLRR